MPEVHRGRPLARASSANNVNQLSFQTTSTAPRSRSTQLSHKVHNTDELRQRALKNDQSRRNSAFNLDSAHAVAPPNKNIPMVGDTGLSKGLNHTSHSHKQIRRWSPVHIENSDSGDETELTMAFKGQHRPFQASAMKHSSMEDRVGSRPETKKDDHLKSAPALGKSSDSSLTEKVSDMSWRSLERSSKASSHASMSTLVPMRRYENDAREDEEERIVQPESYDEDRALTTGDVDDVEIAALAITDIAREIQSFQNLVGNTDYSSDIAGSNRTQQRLLNMKQQHEKQEYSVVPPQADYATKIEHEALLSIWTSIRLRFSSHVSQASKSQPECLAGVLGSIRRQPVKKSTHGYVTHANKDEVLKRMWLGEIHQPLNESLQRRSSEYNEGEDIYKGKGQAFNMSQMASRALETRSDSRSL